MDLSYLDYDLKMKKIFRYLSQNFEIKHDIINSYSFFFNKFRLSQVIQQKYKDLGPLSFHELGVTILFTLCVFLWIFRKPDFVTGWAELVTDMLVFLHDNLLRHDFETREIL